MTCSLQEAASAHGPSLIPTAFLPFLSPLLLPSTKDFLLAFRGGHTCTERNIHCQPTGFRPSFWSEPADHGSKPISTLPSLWPLNQLMAHLGFLFLLVAKCLLAPSLPNVCAKACFPYRAPSPTFCYSNRQ